MQPDFVKLSIGLDIFAYLHTHLNTGTHALNLRQKHTYMVTCMCMLLQNMDYHPPASLDMLECSVP